MVVQTKEQIFAQLAEHNADLRRFGVRRFGLFGSFIRDDQTDKSDLDFLVEFEAGKKSFNNFMGLSLFLEDLFERKVDLLTPESLSPYMSTRILQEVEYAFTA